MLELFHSLFGKHTEKTSVQICGYSSKACATPILVIGSVMGLFLLRNGFFLIISKINPIAQCRPTGLAQCKKNPGYRNVVCTCLQA